MAMLTVDGVALPDPASLEWSLQDVSDSEAGRTQDGKMHKKQIIGEFKDKAAVEDFCKQNNIAYDDITNYLQNMIEHKKQKVNEKLAEALEQGSPKLGRKGRARE